VIRRLIPISLLFCAALAAFACASSTPKKSVRWVPYSGCNAAQCKSWYEECAAECVNQREMGVNECENKCRANVPSCESSCSAG
jgi:hypothetical protein